MNRLALVLVGATLAACSTAPSSDPDQRSIVPGESDTRSPSTGDHVVLPSLGGGMPHLQSGEIMLTGDTGPGSATFTGAGLAPIDGSAPPSFGTGSFSVTLASTTYAATAAQSMFATLPDPSGTSYLVLGVMADDPSAGRVQLVYAVVKQSDFVAGADVALDGVDRYALYVAGPETAEDPDTLAVASTGTLHIAATSTLSGPIDATLDATFAAADPSALAPDPSDPSDPRDPSDPGDPGPDGGTATPPTAGTYTLHFGALGDVQCQGSLAGKEADFQALAPASFGFSDLSVTISVTAGAVTIAGGAPFAAAFGASSAALTSDDGSPFWQFFGDVAGGAGPDGSTLGYAMLGLDASSPSPYAGQAAVIFTLADRNSYCAVGYDATFTP